MAPSGRPVFASADNNHDGEQAQSSKLTETTIMLVVLGLIVIGISSIHLLKTFINAGALTDRVLLAQTVIHVALLLSALAIAWTDRLLTQTASTH